jgi:transposase-like protein
MRKKHDYEALLKYMRMLEDGFSIDYIHNKFGISAERLKCLWLQYQKQGISALHRKKNIQADGVLKQQIVLDIEKNHLTLVQASLKYGVSTTRLSVWLKIFREQGIDALLITKKRGRPPGMGRPRKKKPEEMTELERLRRENHLLKLELEIRKKAQALVEERKARLRAIGRGQSEN